MAYIFDTNIFIRSKNEMPIELWPTFWGKVAEMINNGDVFSHEFVKEEINKGKDELTDWINANASENFYICNDNDIMSEYSKVLNWAQNKNNPEFKQEAILEFAQVADAFLVAAAAAKGYTLVTNETSDPSCRKRVKIPDACNAVGVRYCDLNMVLRELGLKI